MKSIIVNGKFMADRMQGIVRYGREILNELEPTLKLRWQTDCTSQAMHFPIKRKTV